MSEYSPTWCKELYGILIHSRELRILMLWGAAGSLPQMSLDQAVWEADVGKVSEAMRLALGAEVTTLRYASYSVSVDAHQIDAIYVLVSHTPAWEPQAASSLPLFAHEPAVMRGLAGLYPDHIPAPLSIDEQRRWMLLADFGAPIEWDAPVEVQEEMLRVYGELQSDAATRAGDLLTIGCLDRRLERLAAQVDPLLEDTATLASELDAAEIERLRALGPQLQAICAELAGYEVPHTLVHGDLHLGNVARSAGSYLFFDWTDACVAHPFFDTISIFQAKDPNVQAQLRNSYLGVWAAYEPIERLLEAWKLAKPLCALHQAVSYQHIVATLEETSKPELAPGLSYWLRTLLQSLE